MNSNLAKNDKQTETDQASQMLVKIGLSGGIGSQYIELPDDLRIVSRSSRQKIDLLETIKTCDFDHQGNYIMYYHLIFPKLSETCKVFDIQGGDLSTGRLTIKNIIRNKEDVYEVII